MDEHIKDLLALSDKMEVITMVGSGIITAHPCYVFDIHLAAYNGAVATCEFHKGTTELIVPTLYLYTIASTSFNYWWYPPLSCPGGMYFKAGGNVKGCSFHFLRADR